MGQISTIGKNMKNCLMSRNDDSKQEVETRIMSKNCSASRLLPAKTEEDESS